MKHIDLTWYQRISLWNRIGTVQAPSLKEAAVYLRILDRIRPSDAEQQTTKLTTTEKGFGWTLPYADFGVRSIELEDEEAAALIKGLETHPAPLQVSDAAWMLELIAGLQPEKPTEEAAAA
jgi:hypothetical protein